MIFSQEFKESILNGTMANTIQEPVTIEFSLSSADIEEQTIPLEIDFAIPDDLAEV